MKKQQILCLVSLFLSFSLTAAHTSGEKIDWHAPQMSKEIRAILEKHAGRQDTGILASTFSGAERGFLKPYEEASKFHQATFNAAKNSDNVVDLTINTGLSWITAAGGFAASVITCLPAATVGSLIGLKDGVVNSIKGQFEEDNAEQIVALNLYSWIDAIKTARMQFRTNIQQWQKQSGVTSIKQALESMAQNGQLDKFIAEVKMSREDTIALLSGVDKNTDNWNNIFATISKRVKSKTITDTQWSTLTSRLLTWQKTPSFPKVEQQDIEQNIYFAVYFFNIAVGDSKIMSKFLHDIGAN